MLVPPLIYISATIASIFNFISNHMEWFFLTLMVMLLVVAIKYCKNQKTHNRFKNRIALLEDRSKRAQMNPHFILNALNGVQGTIFSITAPR